MENLLYYPYINIPNSDWAGRSLIYYDRIGSIVPQRYLYQEFEPYMRNLVDNGLIEPINPWTVLHSTSRTFQPLLAYFRSAAFNAKKRHKSFRKNYSAKLHHDKFPPGSVRIHEDKFDNDIFYALREMDLAVEDENGWYRVERTTANDLMTFLASVLSAKLQYQAATDQDFRPHNVNARTKEFAIQKKVDGKRVHILNELIPFPEEIDLTKLRKFKIDHHDLLKAFKHRVESIALDPSIDIDTPIFKEKINGLHLQKEELTAKMNEKKLGKIILGSACGILGAAAAFASPAPLAGMLLSGAGFTSAVYSALQIESPEKIRDQTGLKYLSLIDKRMRKPNRFQ